MTRDGYNGQRLALKPEWVYMSKWTLSSPQTFEFARDWLQPEMGMYLSRLTFSMSNDCTAK